MTNGNVFVNDFIEEYEESLYEKYKLYKTTHGTFDEKTTKVHSEWKQILKFVYDNNVDASFTLVKFKNAIDFIGAKLAYQDQEVEFAEYWTAVTKMYYHINEQIRRLLQ